MTQKTSEERKSKKTSPKQKKDLEHTINTLETQLKEKNEKLLRCLADQQNQQKRFEKELAIRETQTKTKYLLELLDLQDLLQQAQHDTNPRQGLKLLLQNLTNFLDREHITYIDCKGKPFDHTIHHAVTTIEQTDCEDNIIVEEIKKGYKRGDLLLRPSQVIVSKKTTHSSNKKEQKSDS